MTQTRLFIIKIQLVTAFFLTILPACAPLGNGESQQTAEEPMTKIAPNSLKMHFQKGQLLSLISLAPKPGSDAADARKAYLQSAFRLANDYGLKPAGSIPVTAVEAGDFSPAAVSFFSWPSARHEARFGTQSEWAAVKATRPDGWDELRIHDAELEKDVSLQFDADKTYTMATAWINPERPDDYDAYLTLIEKAAHASGGRFIYQMREPRFTSLHSNDSAPGRITFVEWDSPEGLKRFTSTASFKTHVHLLQSGATRFELVVLNLNSSSKN